MKEGAFSALFFCFYSFVSLLLMRAEANPISCTYELSIVIPVMNEEENLFTLKERIEKVMEPLSISYELLFVDDGSTDSTFEEIERMAQSNSYIRGVQLSRNFGHQKALFAGLDQAKGVAVLTMDGDLQHPPELIPEMYGHYRKGIEVVNTKRLHTADAGWVKKMTSKRFYRFVNYLSEIEIIEGAADFRIMSRKALGAFLSLGESDRFNRGLVSWLGFTQIYVPYEAPSRIHGKSKYSLKKMIAFALDGITSFSSKPLRMSFFLGMGLFVLSLIYAAFAIVMSMKGQTIEGWTSLLVTVIFIGGIQLMSIGLLGEYVARIFNESKNRPIYLIQKDTDEQGA